MQTSILPYSMPSLFHHRPHGSAKVLVSALLLLAAFAALDRWLLDCLAGWWRFEWIVVLTMAVFVSQIGIMGVVCGRWIEPPLLKWLLYGWTWLLIDLQTLVAWALADQTWWGNVFQVTALLTAQLGLVIIWAFLGPSRWTTRWPFALVLTTVLLLLLIRARYWSDNMAVVFLTQTISLGVVCIVLRWRGIRLVKANPETIAQGPVDADDLQASQFGLRHVLIWTTAIAIVCGLVRAVGLPFQQESVVFYYPLLPQFFCGAAVSFSLLVAFWAALASGRAWPRWCFALLVLPATGAACGALDWHALYARSPWLGQMSWWDFLRNGYVSERYVFTWICLAGATLFAALLFVRSQGYRLARENHRRAEE